MLCIFIHSLCLQRMNPTDYADPLTFPLTLMFDFLVDVHGPLGSPDFSSTAIIKSEFSICPI